MATPIQKLRAIGFTFDLTEQQAKQLWGTVLQIEGRYRDSPGYEQALRAARAAYNAVAEVIVTADTSEEVLRVTIPDIVFALCSKYRWSAFSRESMNGVLSGSISTWEGAQLKMPPLTPHPFGFSEPILPGEKTMDYLRRTGIWDDEKALAMAERIAQKQQAESMMQDKSAQRSSLERGSRQLDEYRAELLSEYKRAAGNPSNRRIYTARNSGINKPEFYEWLRGDLSETSKTTLKFEKFLRSKKPSIPKNPR